MSYILDALRKSERERQTGQVPGLPHLVVDAPKAPPRWVFWLGGVLLIVNLAGLAYWLLMRPRPEGARTEPPAIAAPDALPSTPAASADQRTVNPVVNSGIPAPVQAQPAGTSTIPSDQPAPVPPTPASAPQVMTAAPSTPPVIQANTPPPAAPAPVVVPAAPTASPAYSPAVAPATPAQAYVPPPPAAAAPAYRPTQPSRREITRPAPYSRADALDDAELERETEEELLTDARRYEPDPQESVRLGKHGTPYLQDLPLSFQERIPTLKISMFAYSRNPEERFVIINMKKHRVGDTIPGGALLIEIQSENLLLELDGQKFLLPRF